MDGKARLRAGNCHSGTGIGIRIKRIEGAIAFLLAAASSSSSSTALNLNHPYRNRHRQPSIRSMSRIRSSAALLASRWSWPKHSQPIGTHTFLLASTRFYSATSSNKDQIMQQPANKSSLSIANTPLGSSSASHLLDGLDVYQVRTSDDFHPLSVYGIHSDTRTNTTARRPILLLHGRTWSSVPVFHLLGGGSSSNSTRTTTHTHSSSRSLMEALYEAGLQPYAMDFRGFGGTPPDHTHSVIPNRCVSDVECVLKFIAQRHAPPPESIAANKEEEKEKMKKSDGTHFHLPALLGWSQGALVAQLTAQKSPQIISKLVLYGSIYDPLVCYPRSPLYTATNDHDDNHDNNKDHHSPSSTNNNNKIKNTYNGAIEDFTIEGSIAPEPARQFANAALLTDPYKAEWKFLHQFNNVDPARVHVPTLVVAGDQDPYAPLRVQADLFRNLGRGADRTWSIIADADHAVHLLDGGRTRFIKIVKSFVENGKKGETLE